MERGAREIDYTLEQIEPDKKTVALELERSLSGYTDNKGKSYPRKDLQERKAEALPILSRLLAGLDLPLEKLLDSWRSDERGAIIKENYDAIMALEIKNPGAPRVLCHEFGIRNFSWYPEEMLVKQYHEYINKENRESDKKRRPYGVIINSAHDYTGAFADDKDLWLKLYKDLDALGYSIHVIEGDKKRELAHHLINLASVTHHGKREIGEELISFAVIGGHGTRRSIELNEEEKYYLHLDDMTKYGVRTAKHILKKFATIILNNCTT